MSSWSRRPQWPDPFVGPSRVRGWWIVTGRPCARCSIDAGATKELVEQRDREGGVAVCGAEYHSLLNQSRAAGRHTLDLYAELGGDVTGPMRSLTQFGHRREVALLRRRQPVHADEETVLVELALHVRGRETDILERDRRPRSDIPNVIAPLL